MAALLALAFSFSLTYDKSKTRKSEDNRLKTKTKVNVRLDIDSEVWAKFKEVVHPLTRPQAIIVMVKTAVTADEKPFGEVIEDILKGYISSSPS